MDQRDYDRMWRERQTFMRHPCGWTYEMRYFGQDTMVFRLQDAAKSIDVLFEARITFEREFLDIATRNGFSLSGVFGDYLLEPSSTPAWWKQYVFVSES